MERLLRNAKAERENSVYFKTSEIFNSITGEETAEELDQLAGVINNALEKLRVKDVLLEDYYSENGINPIFVNTLSQKTFQYKLTDVYLEIQNGEEVEPEVVEFALTKDIFKPLIHTITQALNETSPEKAARMMYLNYQIQNPFQFTPRFAVDIAEEGIARLKEKDKDANIDEATRKRFTQTVSELALTAYEWKSAWTYFGPHRAKQLLEMMQSEEYGAKLTSDLIYFSKSGLLVCPPQILDLLYRIPFDDDEDPVKKLKSWYASGRNLAEFADKEGLKYQITGLQRAFEYDEKVWKLTGEYVDENDAIMMSIGGGVGIIEIERAKKLGWTGPIVIIDKYSREDGLENTLVVRNEFRYEPASLLDKDEVREMQDNCPVPLFFVQTEMPVTADELKTIMSDTGIPGKPVRLIFDQRTSALYLNGERLLESITNSLELLKEGGVYFLTKSFADKLVTDQIVGVKDGKVNYVIAPAHTNAFISDYSPSISSNGQSYVAEGVVHIDLNDNPLMPQEGRVSKKLSDAQKLLTVKILADNLSVKFPFLLRDIESGAHFTADLAYAYAAAMDFGHIIPEKLPDGTQNVYLWIQSYLIQLIKIAGTDPDKLKRIKLPDFPTIPGLSKYISTVRRFIVSVRDDPAIMVNCIAELNQAFSQAKQVVCSPNYYLVATRNLPIATLEIMLEHPDFTPEFIRHFWSKFYLDESWHFAGIAAEAFRHLYTGFIDWDELSISRESDRPLVLKILEIIEKTVIAHNLNARYDPEINTLIAQDSQFERIRQSVGRIVKISPETWGEIIRFCDVYFSTKTNQGAC